MSLILITGVAILVLLPLPLLLQGDAKDVAGPDFEADTMIRFLDDYAERGRPSLLDWKIGAVRRASEPQKRDLYLSAYRVRQDMLDLIKPLRAGDNSYSLPVKGKWMSLREFFEDIRLKGLRCASVRLSDVTNIVTERLHAANALKTEVAVRYVRENAKKRGYDVAGVSEPRRPVSLPDGRQSFGYGIVHVFLRHSKSGITGEWRIGTDAESRLWHHRGIGIPRALGASFSRRGLRNTLRDLDRGIFSAVQERSAVALRDDRRTDPFYRLDVASGLDALSARVDRLAGQASLDGTAVGTVQGRIDDLHREAGAVLEKIAGRIGVDAVGALLEGRCVDEMPPRREDVPR